jgi:hypothetical protein
MAHRIVPSPALARLLVVTGALLVTVGPSRAGYLVDVGEGHRMTVDSYWNDGARVHLVRGAVDLSLPGSRVRLLRAVTTAREDEPVLIEPATSRSPAPMEQRPTDLGAEEHRIGKHLLRVQQQRFEARMRGDSPRTLRHLEREFRRTQQRHADVTDAIERSAAVD